MRNDTFATTLYFGKNDPDINFWIQSVPKGLFSHYIREAIKAYINNDMSFVFPVFKTKHEEKDNPKKIWKSFIVPNDEENSEVYEFVNSLSRTNMEYISQKVKEIIRFFMRNSNLKMS